MAEPSWWESFEVKSGHVIERVKTLIEEGNVRRVVVKQGSRTVAEFPLTVGVVGAVLAPVVAAIGALAALLTECTIEVERSGRSDGKPESRDSHGAQSAAS